MSKLRVERSDTDFGRLYNLLAFMMGYKMWNSLQYNRMFKSGTKIEYEKEQALSTLGDHQLLKRIQRGFGF